MIQVSEKNPRSCILGYPVDLISMEDALKFAESFILAGKSGQVVTINPEIIMQAIKNQAFSDVINQAELIIPDGFGIILTLKKLGINNIVQLPGIEFSQGLIGKCAQKGYSVGFLGASKDVLNAAVKEFKSKYPDLNIVFCHDGYFGRDEEERIISELKYSRPNVLFVGLGVPSQELWIAEHKKILNSTLMVGVGGSFDVWSKKIKRAPALFRKFGLEWLYRLLNQPSRFSRMFPTLPLFFIKVMFTNSNTRKEY